MKSGLDEEDTLRMFNTVGASNVSQYGRFSMCLRHVSNILVLGTSMISIQIMEHFISIKEKLGLIICRQIN